MILRYRQFGDVILVVDPQPNPAPGGNYDGVAPSRTREFRAVAYYLADVYGLRVLDVNGLFGPYAEVNAAGLMADSVHPSAAGYQRIARGIDRIMAP